MKNVLKNIGVILIALIVVFALSHLTDVVLEKSGLMKLPFYTNPLWMILLVIVYRMLYVAVGGYMLIMLAPLDKGRLLLNIFTAIGFMLGVLGTIAMWHEPPHWYAISLVILGIPAAYIGGMLRMATSKQEVSLN